MNGKKAKAARRAAKMLASACGELSNEKHLYKKMKETLKLNSVRKKMYG